MKIDSINKLATAVVILLAFVALSSAGIYLTVGMLYSTIVIVTPGVYLLAMAKSSVDAMMQESKISGDLEIANLNEYMDRIENRIEKIDGLLEKV